MALPIFLQKIKKTITKYFPSPAWPWEIISGLFIVLILINSFYNLAGDNNFVSFALLMIVINLIWGIFDGLMHIFTNLLEKGRYNKLILRVKSSDEKLATQILSRELDSTILGIFSKKTRRFIVEAMLKDISSAPLDIVKKQKISKDTIMGALLCIFFVFLPCIIILPFFLLVPDVKLAIFISNLIGLLILFAFGYKLGSCTNRNKILTGIVMMLVGLVLMAIGSIIGA